MKKLFTLFTLLYFPAALFADTEEDLLGTAWKAEISDAGGLKKVGVMIFKHFNRGSWLYFTQSEKTNKIEFHHGNRFELSGDDANLVHFIKPDNSEWDRASLKKKGKLFHLIFQETSSNPTTLKLLPDAPAEYNKTDFENTSWQETTAGGNTTIYIWKDGLWAISVKNKKGEETLLADGPNAEVSSNILLLINKSGERFEGDEALIRPGPEGQLQLHFKGDKAVFTKLSTPPPALPAEKEFLDQMFKGKIGKTPAQLIINPDGTWKFNSTEDTVSGTSFEIDGLKLILLPQPLADGPLFITRLPNGQIHLSFKDEINLTQVISKTPSKPNKPLPETSFFDTIWTGKTPDKKMVLLGVSDSGEWGYWESGKAESLISAGEAIKVKRLEDPTHPPLPPELHLIQEGERVDTFYIARDEGLLTLTNAKATLRPCTVWLQNLVAQ